MCKHRVDINGSIEIVMASGLGIIRASPIIRGYASASASGIKKWPPSRMQMQTQGKLLCIMHHL
jgi:hypothetical protein